MSENVLTLGLDLGKFRDSSAIIVVETTPAKRHKVQRIVKVPTGTPYPDVVDIVERVYSECATAGPTTLVCDATSMGAPVVDLLRQSLGARVLAVTISGGATVNQTSPVAFTVPKRELVAGLYVVLETRRLGIPRRLAFAGDLKHELSVFEFTVSTSGHDSYEAGGSAHDDLVTALSLALWRAEKGPRRGWRMHASHWRRDEAGAVVGIRDRDGTHPIGMEVKVTVNPHVVRPVEPAPEPGAPVRKMPGPKPEPAQQPGKVVVGIGDRLHTSRSPRRHVPPPQPESFMRSRTEDGGDPAPADVVAQAEALAEIVRPKRKRGKP
jgi:hypothetical protein